MTAEPSAERAPLILAEQEKSGNIAVRRVKNLNSLTLNKIPLGEKNYNWFARQPSNFKV
jgi:hypothetical protein